MASVDLSQLPQEYLDANQGPKVDAITIFAFTLAVIGVSLRFLARVLTKASLWWDDWLVLAALIFAVGPLVLTIFSYTTTVVENNFGKHAPVAGLPSLLTFFKALYAFEIVYPFPIALTKFSILMYYKRLFRVRSIKLPIYTVMGLIMCWVIYTEAAAIFTCTPVRKVWDPTVVGGTCIDIRSFFIGIAVPNIFTDLALLVIPLPYLWGLQVKLPQKIAVMFVFILGGFIFVVSIVRLTALLSIDNEDATWSYVPTCIWTNVEVHIGIFTASVPAFWPLLRALKTGHVMSPSQRTNTAGITAPNTGPSFLSRSRRAKNPSTTHEDEQGFVYLKNMGSESPVPSRQGLPDSDSEERGVRFTAPKQAQEKTARIQVRNDWTVSSESYVGRNAEHERSFMR